MSEYDTIREQIARDMHEAIYAKTITDDVTLLKMLTLADWMISNYEKYGYVRLAKDQSLPENPYHPNPLREYDHQITEAGMCSPQTQKVEFGLK